MAIIKKWSMRGCVKIYRRRAVQERYLTMAGFGDGILLKDGFSGTDLLLDHLFASGRILNSEKFNCLVSRNSIKAETQTHEL